MEHYSFRLFLSVMLLIFSITLFSQDFFPSSEDLNNTARTKFEIIPENDPNSYKQLIQYETNTSNIVDLNATLMESLADRMGFLKPSSDLNLSKQEDLKGYVDAIKLRLPSAGNSIADQMRQKMQSFDSNNPNTFSKTTILAQDGNSTEKRVINTMKDVHDAIRSRVANLKTIDCYVTRKLANSYFCPLPSMATNSFFKGGSFADNKDTAKKDCEKLCEEPSSCLYKDMNKDKVVSASYTNKNISNNEQVLINADAGMLPKFIELNLEVSHTNHFDTADTNNTEENNLTKYINEKKFKFLMDVEVFSDSLSAFVPIFTSRSVLVSEKNLNLKVYLDSLKGSQYKVKFYDHYYSDGNITKTDENLTISLLESKLEYVDNKFWFCSATHFTEDTSKCQGEIKSVVIGSSTYKVCVTDVAREREPVYGAYYSQADCESNCKLHAECKPTYRHLLSFDPSNLPQEVSDIDVGCVNSVTNTSCNKELCLKLFNDDEMPLVEKSWTNDDNIKITVANGVLQPGTIRPRIDISRGVSVENNETEREKISLGEMVEISHQNMLEMDNFNVSSKTVKESYPMQNAYSTMPNGTSKSIFWLLKPNSFDIDDGATYYLYNLFEIGYEYRPFYGVYETADGVQSGKTDPNIRIQDRVFLIKTQSGFKPFKQIEFASGKFKKETCSSVFDETLGTTKEVCNSSYSWGPMDAYKKESFKTYHTGNYVIYDENTYAEHFNSHVFNSDKKWETNLALNSVEEISSQEGVLFHSQMSQNNGSSFKKVYDGAEEILEKANFSYLNGYGVYSKTQLTYKQLSDFINKETMFYSTITQTPDKIIHNGQFDNERVKFFVSGKPNNLSVNADFLPTSAEEGKKTFIFMLLYEDKK